MKCLSLFIHLSAIFVLSSHAAAAEKKTAIVYSGPGACAENCISAAAERAQAQGFKIRLISDKEWPADLFDDAALWIQPGGHSKVVAQSLSHEQKERLRKFISDGGGYVGFCAGAFFASKAIILADGTPYGAEPLGILPVSSAVLQVTPVAIIATVNWLGQSRQMYWEGGPYFLPPIPAQIQVVSQYENPGIAGEAAALRANYGRGRVFVTGFHPEAPQYWRDFYQLVDSDGLDFQYAEAMIRWASGIDD